MADVTFSSNPINLPPELVIMIAAKLDKTSLTIMMQVCGAWYDILASSVWSKVTAEDWHIRRFPRRAVETPLLCRALRNIRSLEWYCQSIMELEGRTMETRVEVPQETIAMVIAAAPHLDSLAINALGSATLPCYIESVSGLRSLKQLTMEVNVRSSGQPVPFRKLEKMLANLDEFNTYGRWFSYNEPLSEANASWRMRKMDITLDDFFLLLFCPRLKELKVSTGLADYNRPVSFKPLKSCPELTSLRSWHPKVTDLMEVLASLKKLQSLAFITTGAHEIAAIAKEPDNNNPLPKLVSLEIHPKSLSKSEAKRFDTHLLQILATRTKLKTIVITDHPIVPTTIFKEPGQYWGCKHLETVELEIGFVYNTAERKDVWEAAFRQFGQLAFLKKLCIRSSEFGTGWNTGVSHLASAQQLERMTLGDQSKGIWTEDMLVCVLKATPNLAQFAITHLHQSQTLDILRGWIENAGRDSSILGHYCD
ncbi:hypothetical protein BGX33_006672 [Mortierella sp. NVP41]|nr:hypothetical protein BGX33_006672 [Mortierella sp. NVP41]